MTTHLPASPFPLFRLLCGSVCISFSPVFIKLAAVSPDSAGFWRMFFAGLSLLVLMKLRRETLHMTPRARRLLSLAGLSLAIDFMFWHRSIALVGPGLSTLLGNFQVFFTALFGWLIFRQGVSKLFLMAVGMALFGLLLITGVDAHHLAAGTGLGILFGLLTAIFYSGYILLVKEALKDRTALSVPAMLLVAVASSLFLATVTPLTGGSFVIPDRNSLLALLGVGLLSTTIGWSLITSAIREVQATVAGLVLLLQPTLALVWDMLFFDRPTGLREGAGILLILSAIYIGSLRRQED